MTRKRRSTSSPSLSLSRFVSGSWLRSAILCSLATSNALGPATRISKALESSESSAPSSRREWSTSAPSRPRARRPARSPCSPRCTARRPGPATASGTSRSMGMIVGTESTLRVETQLPGCSPGRKYARAIASANFGSSFSRAGSITRSPSVVKAGTAMSASPVCR